VDPDSGRATYGWTEGEKAGPIDGLLLGPHRRLPANLLLASLRLRPPIAPSKIVCVARNYEAHAREQEAPVPEVPMLFLKPPSALLASGEEIELPPQSQRIEYEAELAVVVGRLARWIPPDRATEYIFGYTAANDVTARDLQQRDGQWTRAKGFDTFCPLGPWIETKLDPADLRIVCRVNGQVRQLGSTRDMIFSVPKLIAYISSIMSLLPGDVVLTGTPAGVGRLEAGDQVDIEVQGIGVLHNRVVASATP
jgi:2-keto-4-pentenoate hydratase/2-oxohepta-3-ene-1,7-dioic acid hydratase in catechol pathway